MGGPAKSQDPLLLRRLLRAKDRMDAASHEEWPIPRLAKVSSFSMEASLNWNNLIRQTHRWLAILFTLTVIACFLSLMGKPPQWTFYRPLPPLFLLMFSGLYMFFLAYFQKDRRA